jgi:hypothetical protein
MMEDMDHLQFYLLCIPLFAFLAILRFGRSWALSKQKPPTSSLLVGLIPAFLVTILCGLIYAGVLDMDAVSACWQEQGDFFARLKCFVKS